MKDTERQLREREVRGGSRRQFLQTTAAGLLASVGVPKAAEAFDFESFFQKHFRQMSDEEVSAMLSRLGNFQGIVDTPFCLHLVSVVDKQETGCQPDQHHEIKIAQAPETTELKKKPDHQQRR